MKADFAMALHFHQPVGNFDHVVERACEACYMPFLETLKKYPDIRMGLHFTGCLLEWAENKMPEMTDHIKELTRNGQIEVMTGGFYEPILPSIPRGDRQAQIKMLTEYVRQRFGFDAKGAWVAERVWEPGLPSDLKAAGVDYVILDDTHFLYSGVPKDGTYGYYMTEDNGNAVAVFPSDKTLRYFIPYRMPEEILGYMKDVCSRHHRPLFVYGDDAEKFGEWPGTHKWVYEDKWLEKFFDEVSANSDWLTTRPLCECLEDRRPLGRVYLPTTSYEEMLEWALPADSQERLEDVIEDIRNSGKEEWYKQFIRGGFWRNFFTKYPESNHMNKKMLYVSDKVNELERAGDQSADLIENIKKDLLRGQCNCAYWHGVFGGLYLFHLRRAIYHHLIKSETEMDKLIYGRKQFVVARSFDMDSDGQEEVVLENRAISVYIDPSDGGTIKEFDSKKLCQNLCNTLSRKKEAYHRKIAEKIARHDSEDGDQGEVRTIHDGIQQADPGMADHLNYDWYGRHCLIDHFPDTGTDIEGFSKCMYREAGDFSIEAYDAEVSEKNSEVRVKLFRQGQVDGERVDICKAVSITGTSRGFEVEYKVTNRSEKELELLFAPEMNITMPDADSDRYSLKTKGGRRSYSLSETVETRGGKGVEIADAHKELSWKLDIEGAGKVKFWHFPVMTLSQSEKAYELNYQGSAVIPLIRMSLGPGKTFGFSLKVSVS